MRIRNIEELQSMGQIHFPPPFEGVVFDVSGFQLQAPSLKHPIGLPPAELGILVATIKRPRELTPYGQIVRTLNQMMGEDYYVYPNDGKTLHALACYLRYKVENCLKGEKGYSPTQKILESKMSLGYILLPR